MFQLDHAQSISADQLLRFNQWGILLEAMSYSRGPNGTWYSWTLGFVIWDLRACWPITELAPKQESISLCKHRYLKADNSLMAFFCKTVFTKLGIKVSAYHRWNLYLNKKQKGSKLFLLIKDSQPLPGISSETQQLLTCGLLVYFFFLFQLFFL